jgi:hypothetical protein
MSQENPSFIGSEVAKFQKRLEEGYDLTNDHRYNQWLSSSVATLNHSTSFAKVMKTIPTVKFPEIPATKTSSRVVTSSESLKAMREKEKERKQ